MKTQQRSSFRFSPVASAIALVLASPYAMQLAHAGAGFGDGVDATNAPVKVPSYHANSPTGKVTRLAPVTGATTVNATTQLPLQVSSGKSMRKFVDTLPGFGATKANNLGQYLPLAVAEKWVNLDGVTTTDDYIEIAAIEYSEKMHSDLPKATKLRGYVQLSTARNPGKRIALKYPDGSPILDAASQQVYAFDNPHHLGPIINAKSGTAMRVKFVNYLPVGAGGELFIPVDTTITGAGVGPDGVTPYSQNRAVMHLAGGGQPWISSGNPHQWVAPAAEVAAQAAGLGQGVSVRNVPDMADPGPGANTLYFPNNQSARLSFYHDRTNGLTRLNAYAGMEAGYLVTDATEQSLIARGIIPADQIPLIFEDKTFVPENIAQQDARWNVAKDPVTGVETAAPIWGQAGDLWFPHVYEPNQDPNSAFGVNAVGRWDFGPWFWPIFPTTAELPSGHVGDATFTPEAYLDTPVINGTAYPTVTVDPKAYRFRILNASNDRYINLGVYKADTNPAVAPELDANGNPIFNADGTQKFFQGTEIRMVPALADATGAPLVPSNTGAGVAYDPDCLCQYPALASNVKAEASGPVRAWPLDARRGGVPNPADVGPDIIAIGNDGGFLPFPVDIPSQPLTFEANRRSITVNNAYGYGLLLGPAERSDAIIDFSQYAGQTLIVYNDATAPFPFTDERNDYYTGNPDLSSAGGNYSTKPGYGPNTRTIMQIKVKAAPVAATGRFNANALVTELPAAYAATQPTPIVPAVAYNSAFKTNNTDIYGEIALGTTAQQTLDFSTAFNGGVTLTGLRLIYDGGVITPGAAGATVTPNQGSGTGYDPAKPPTVRFNNVVNGVDCLPSILGNTSATARALVNPETRQVSEIVDFTPGSGYVCAPTVSFDSDIGVGASVAVLSAANNFHSLPVLPIAEQELFDNRGRYNKTGGVELAFTNAAKQTTIPLNYIDAATETIAEGQEQVWKITVNGLFSNSLSFNFVDVQLLNRVGWDGTVKPPSSNELGWKNTVRMNPLEDVVIAVRAKRPAVPFGMPNSVRLLDPSKPAGAAGSGLGFTSVPNDVPQLNTRVNREDDFGHEYFWSSAILSNSENDFMRPIVYRPTVVKPDAPLNLTDALGNGTLSWTDTTPAGVAATLADPKNEIGFKVLSATRGVDGNLGALAPVLVAGVPVTLPANSTRWVGPAPVADTAYAVVAFNSAGDSTPSLNFIEEIPVAPTTFNAGPVAYNAVTLTWSGGTSSNKVDLYRAVGAAPAVLLASLPGSSTGYVDNAVTALNTYTYQLKATNALQPVATGTAISAALTVNTPEIPVAAPSALSATVAADGTSVTLGWTDNANNETAYWVEVSADGGATFSAPMSITRSAAQRTSINGRLTSRINTVPGSVYVFKVTAVNVTGTATSTSDSIQATVSLVPTPPLAATGLSATAAGRGRANLSWIDNAGNESAYIVTATNTISGAVTTSTVRRRGAVVGQVGGTVTTQTARLPVGNYSFTVQTQSTQFGQQTLSVPSAAVTVSVN